MNYNKAAIMWFRKGFFRIDFQQPQLHVFIFAYILFLKKL